MELRYRHAPGAMTDEFPYTFQCISEPLDEDDFDDCREAVIAWCEERFGDGAVSTPLKLWIDWSVTGSPGVAASYAWVMMIGGDVGFQHVDHAFEFKMRWC